MASSSGSLYSGVMHGMQVARHADSPADKDFRVAVAVALQRQRGGGFDRLTKTKYASKLLQVPTQCLARRFAGKHVGLTMHRQINASSIGWQIPESFHGVVVCTWDGSKRALD